MTRHSPPIPPGLADILELADWRPRTYSPEQVTALAALGRLASTAFQLRHGLAEARSSFPGAEVGGEMLTVAEAERRAIVAALARTRGNISAALRVLKMGRTTLYRKLRACGIDLGRPLRHRRGDQQGGGPPPSDTSVGG